MDTSRHWIHYTSPYGFISNLVSLWWLVIDDHLRFYGHPVSFSCIQTAKIFPYLFQGQFIGDGVHGIFIPAALAVGLWGADFVTWIRSSILHIKYKSLQIRETKMTK